MPVVDAQGLTLRFDAPRYAMMRKTKKENSLACSVRSEIENYWRDASSERRLLLDEKDAAIFVRPGAFRSATVPPSNRKAGYHSCGRGKITKQEFNSR
jgi:hypothetical protein